MKKPKLDKQGRIVIPKPLRKEMNIKEGSPLIITYEKGAAVVRPDKSTCRLCGSQIESERTLRLCDKCIEEVLEYCFEKKKNNDNFGKKSGFIIAEAINDKPQK